MLPIFAGAVVGALCLAHHWCRRRRGAVRLGVAALLVAVLATAIGIGQIALTATYDYRTQSNQLALMHRLHDHGTTAYRVDPGTDLPAASSGCSGLCSSKQQTLAIHLRAIAIATILLLVTNTMLVLWALALRGGRVWARRRGPAPVVATETEPGAAVAVA